MQNESKLKKIPKVDAYNENSAYSPILEIECSKLVIISGQVSDDLDDNIVGETIEEQSKVTLENCKRQLKKANCTLDDVFKVTVYLKDLSLWSDFNKIYKQYLPHPRPVRTAIGVQLLEGYLVEIEMWAMKK